jgi:DNA-binding phage protein
LPKTQACRGRAFTRQLSADGNPELATVLKVIKALGLKLTLAPNHHGA